MVVLERDVLGAGSKLLRLRHGDAGLIVLVHLADELGGHEMKGENLV